MEKLKLKYNYLSQALKTLRQVLDRFNSMDSDDESLKQIFRDSLIQRFEYSFDSFWKYIKRYLETVAKINLELKSPKNTLNVVHKQLLISHKELNIALQMLDSRNITSHLYKEEVAEQVSSNIEMFCSTMILITNRLLPK